VRHQHDGAEAGLDVLGRGVAVGRAGEERGEGVIEGSGSMSAVSAAVNGFFAL
jgi:hypothetical protein